MTSLVLVLWYSAKLLLAGYLALDGKRGTSLTTIHFFGPSHKMYNVLSHHMIKCINIKKFRNDAYLAIYELLLLSYVVVVDAQSGEHCDFFWLRWDICKFK